MKSVVGVLVAGLLVFAAVGPAGAKAAPKATQVFEDPAGDAGNNAAGPHPGAAEAGFDLIKGEIVKEGKDSLKFTVTHASMPPTGPPGEKFRLIWGIGVDTVQYEMTIKSLDVGEPDVVASAMGQDPVGEERVGQVYQGVARLEECGFVTTGINWAMCDTIAYYDAVFDPATATASWVIDMKTLGAKKGTVIAGGGGGRATTGCVICWVPQYQERSLTPQSMIDSAVQTLSYTVK